MAQETDNAENKPKQSSKFLPCGFLLLLFVALGISSNIISGKLKARDEAKDEELHQIEKVTGKTKEIFLRALNQCLDNSAKDCFAVENMYSANLIIGKNRRSYFFEKGLSISKTECERGDIDACNVILSRVTIRKDFGKLDEYTEVAINKFKEACENSDFKSCGYLGELYYEGKIVGRDIYNGIRLQDAACSAGDNSSCLLVGTTYSLGAGVDQDNNKSFEYYMIGCKNGSGACCFSAYRVGDIALSMRKLLIERYPGDNGAIIDRVAPGNITDKNKQKEILEQAISISSENCKNANTEECNNLIDIQDYLKKKKDAVVWALKSACSSGDDSSCNEVIKLNQVDTDFSSVIIDGCANGSITACRQMEKIDIDDEIDDLIKKGSVHRSSTTLTRSLVSGSNLSTQQTMPASAPIIKTEQTIEISRNNSSNHGEPQPSNSHNLAKDMEAFARARREESSRNETVPASAPVIKTEQTIEILRNNSNNYNEPQSTDVFTIARNGSTYRIFSAGNGIRVSEGKKEETFTLPLSDGFFIDRLYYIECGGMPIFVYEESDVESSGGIATKLDRKTLKQIWTTKIHSLNIGHCVCDTDYFYVNSMDVKGKVALTDGHYVWKINGLYEKYQDYSSSMEAPQVFEDTVLFVGSDSIGLKKLERKPILVVNKLNGQIVEIRK